MIVFALLTAIGICPGSHARTARVAAFLWIIDGDPLARIGHGCYVQGKEAIEGLIFRAWRAIAGRRRRGNRRNRPGGIFVDPLIHG